MSETFSFIVPGPPVGKQRMKLNRKTGGKYGTDKSKAYEEQIGWFALDAGIEPVLTICHLDVRWRRNLANDEDELEITLVQTDDPLPKLGHRPDGDNVLKTVGDALNGIGYKDDKQISWWSLGREI